MTRRLSFLCALTLIGALGACGSDGGDRSGEPAGDFSTDLTDAEAYPVVVSSEVVVGENRFLIGLLDENDAPIGGEDIDISVSFDRDGEDELAAQEMEFVLTVPPDRGVYAAYPEFEQAGSWFANFTIEGEGISERLRQAFEVKAEGTTPALGAAAPSSETPTGDDVKKLTEISTDPHPDPRFYRLSIDEAIDEGRPFVVTFATPKFCSSAVCGPTLDIVKKVAKDFPRLTFIHSEIYQDLEPTNPVVPAVEEWGLPSEPWIFVVDAEGEVAAKYEGSVAASELRDALERL
ncbi:MAG TPA: FixH family protein [Actinomycetota bacterium]|nr:FixH family protein [Actinomycetota bacterium]